MLDRFWENLNVIHVIEMMKIKTELEKAENKLGEKNGNDARRSIIFLAWRRRAWLKELEFSKFVFIL